MEINIHDAKSQKNRKVLEFSRNFDTVPINYAIILT